MKNREDIEFLRSSISDDISVPESLSPENITSLVKSEGVKKSKRGVIRRFVAVGVAACLMITGVSVLWERGFFTSPEIAIEEAENATQDSAVFAVTYDELLGFIKTYAAEHQKENQRGDFYYSVMEDAEDSVVNGSVAVAPSSKNEAEDMPQTNNFFGAVNLREENVYEDDILITDGEYFYAVDKYGKRISIIKANPDGTLERVYEGVETEYDNNSEKNETVYYSGLYKYENYLVATYTRYIYENDYYAKELSGAAIYDISDKASPVIVKEIALDGNYVSSRIIDGKLILISRYSITQYFGTEDEENLIPGVYNGELKENIPCDCIAYSPADDPEAYVNIAKLDLLDPEKPFTVTAFLGNVAETYCTSDTLYTIGNKYQYSRGGVLVDSVVSFGSAMISVTNSKTTVTKLDISGEKPEILCKTEFEGGILNSYSIDEHEGYLRVAVTKGFGTEAENFIYVFDKSLCKVGEITGLAKGEQIKSARFMGDTAYVVTFVQTDPLFVIDLSNPEKPEIVGEVKLPGFSSYLHPVGDGLLVGVGVGGTETGTDGSSKISLFDVSDPKNPKEIDYLTFPTSSLGVESKAFVSISENSFLIPYENWSYTGEYDEDENYYKYYCAGGALEISVKNKKLVLENAYLAQMVESTARANFIGDFAYIFNNGEGSMASFSRKTGEFIYSLEGENKKNVILPINEATDEILY